MKISLKKIALGALVLLALTIIFFAFQENSNSPARLTNTAYPSYNGKWACKPEGWRELSCPGGCLPSRRKVDPYYVDLKRVQIYMHSWADLDKTDKVNHSEEIADIVREAYVKRFSSLPEKHYETSLPGCYGRAGQAVVVSRENYDEKNWPDYQYKSPKGGNEDGVLDVWITVIWLPSSKEGEEYRVSHIIINEYRSDIGVVYGRKKSNIVEFTDKNGDYLPKEFIIKSLYNEILG